MVNRPLLTEQLLGAKTYREFLRGYFAQSKGFASFARAAGFSARSYPRDVANGKKRITPASLPRFVRALGLKGALKSYFILLVTLDEPKVNVSGLSCSEVLEKLGKLKNRLRPALEARVLNRSAPEIFAREKWPEIYAAMGTLETGATTFEVAQRTGFAASVCEAALAHMAKAGLATHEKSKGRYLPKSPHLVFGRQSSRSSYQQYFQKTLEWMTNGARQNFEADDRLYFASTLSVRSADLPKLRTELRELLLRFADHAECAEGDRVVRFCAGLAPTR